jgi:hypothetical protein
LASKGETLGHLDTINYPFRKIILYNLNPRLLIIIYDYVKHFAIDNNLKKL